jgi:transketolase
VTRRRAATPLQLDEQSRAFRREILRVLGHARRGHLASAFSIVEILRVLYEEVLSVDPARPEWEDRDRFILSKGHACLALYVALARRGFLPAEELCTFCAFGSRLGGHPERGKVPGVEASTGALGHGLSIGVGHAIWGQRTGRPFRTVVLLGDGELDEGAVWEAALAAAKHRLERLTVLVDCNGMQSFGPTAAVLGLEPLAAKWRAFGFAVREIDGHDLRALRRVLRPSPLRAGLPAAVICRTVKGRGIPAIEHDPSWHHKSRVTDAELEELDRGLGEGCRR